jgi:hypothetical protein
MRLSYWVAKSIDPNADIYDIRGKTRQAVEEKLLARGDGKYESPKRVVTPEFAGSFDMLEQCLNVDGPWWEDAENKEC